VRKLGTAEGLNSYSALPSYIASSRLGGENRKGGGGSRKESEEMSFPLRISGARPERRRLKRESTKNGLVGRSAIKAGDVEGLARETRPR